ncbi:MAG: hypothetical protein KA715_14045 [Xanthomonadaceae bacterium]|nr:hypothetical protein [Xanthomonadaceae bacterium]
MRLILTLLCLTALVACGGGDNAPEKREMAVGSCMKKVPGTLNDYFDGRASEKETDAVFDCIQDSLKLFTERTSGQSEGIYTQDELKRFVERFIMDGKNLRPEMITETLTLKSALFGGTPSQITTLEIESFRKFLTALKNVSQLIRTDLPLSISSSSDAAIERARLSAELLGDTLSQAKTAYTIESALRFAREIQLSIDSPTLAYWLNRKPLIETGLKVLISKTPEQIKPTDWKPILLTSYQALKMGRAARRWAGEPGGFFDVPGFAAWEQVYQSTTDLLNSAIDRNPDQALKAIDLMDLLKQLHQADLASIKPEVFEQFLIFKKAWFGSANLDLTKQDMEKCKLWANRFHESGVKLKPYFPITLKTNEEAFVVLESVLDNWAERLSESASSFEFKDLKNFLIAIQSQFHSQEIETFTAQFDSYMRVFQWSLGSKRTSIERADWKPLVKLMMSSFRVKSAINPLLSVKENEWLSPSINDEIDHAINTASNLFTWIQKTNQNQKIEFSSVKDLIPSSFEQTLLKFKTPIAGGEASTTTASELKKILTWIRDLRLAAIPVYHQLPITPSDSQLKIDQFNIAIGNLSKVLTKLSGQMTWILISSLVKEIHKKTPSDGTRLFISRESWVQEIVSAFTLPNTASIQPSDWAIASKSIQLGLSAFSKTKKLSTSGQYVYKGSALNSFDSAIRELLGWLNYVVQTRPSKALTVRQLKNIVNGLQPDEMPVAVKKETLSAFIGPLSARLISAKNIDSYTETEVLNFGIRSAALLQLQAELDRYVAIQTVLPKLFSLTDCIKEKYPQFLTPNSQENTMFFDCTLNKTPSKSDPYQLQIWKFNLVKVLRNTTTLGTLGLSKAHAAGLRELIFYAQPMLPASGEEVYFPKLNETQNLTINSISETHWLRILTKSIIRGYAKDASRAQAYTGINEEEMKIFIDDVRDLGLELFIIDPLTQNIHGKRFFEGTHFTPSARGQTLIDVAEFSELITYLKSGSTMSLKPNKILAERCPNLKGSGYGYPFIESECYRKVFFANAEIFWKSLPNMARFYKNLNDVDKKLFRDLIEFCADAYAVTVDAKWMTSADTRTFMVLLQYIEALVQRFDQNMSGTLDLGSWTLMSPRFDEVSDAFPIFKTKIAEVAKNVTNEYILDKAFTYMLAKGEIPVEGTTSFNKWLATPQSFQANKLNILKIFAEIQRSLNAKPDEPLRTQ